MNGSQDSRLENGCRIKTKEQFIEACRAAAIPDDWYAFVRDRTKPVSMDGLVELEPGMVTTDEPGVYLEGEYGIRIENELLCVAGEENEYGQFLQFEHLTLCPIDLEPVIVEALSPEERRDLNAYHAMVFDRLRGGLSEEEAAWLKEITRPL